MSSTPIGALIERVQTWNPAREPEREFDYIDLSAVDNTRKVITSATQMRGAAAPSRARQLVAVGDVLVSTVRPNLNAVAVVPPALDGATASTGFTVLRPSARVDGRYLFHWVRSPDFVGDMVRKSTGASYPAVSDRIVKESEVPAPPIAEQRRIAAILDRADAIRLKRRQVLAHLQEILPARFARTVANSQFSTRPLADMAEIWDCPHSTPRWTTTGQVCLRTSNLTAGGWNWSDTRFVDEAQYISRSKGGGAQPGDIVLSREGTVGIAAIVRPGMRVCMGQRLVQVRSRAEVFLPEWALACLLTALHPSRIAHSMVGSTAQHLNVKDLRELHVPVPDLGVQHTFADLSARVERARSRVVHQVATDDALFASLQARAFRGESNAR